MIDHLIGHQLRLLVGQGTHLRFVELTVSSGGIDLLADIVEFGVALFF